MKFKFVSLLLLSASMLFGGEKVKISSVVTGDLWSNGFSATIKTTSNFPGMPVTEPYKMYTDDNGNNRIDTKDKITIYRNDDGLDKVYSYDKISKTYSVLSMSDMYGGNEDSEGTDKPAEFDKEELVEKAGSEMFAGVKCDKYKMNREEGEESEGEQYLFINPAKKVFTGMEIKTGDFYMRTEFTDIKFNVDKSLFKPLSGYKKIN